MIESRLVSRIDLNLLGTAVVLAVIGCVLIYSATASPGDSAIHRKQILWVSLGIVAMLLIVAIDYHTLLDVSPILYGLGLAALLYLLIWGRATANVHSWIRVGSFQAQPSEFVKVLTCLALAKYFDSNDRVYLSFVSFWIVAALVGVPMILILLQPDFGTAATFTPLLAAAMFFGGIRPRTWLIALLIVLVAFPAGWFFLLKPYQKERVLTFLDPSRDPLGSGYQVIQARIAIGSGGLTGKGFMKGTQARLEFLPARHTDFIFAVLGEEWGFVGVVVVLALYLFLVIQALQIAREARDRGGTFLVICLLSFMVFHIFVNVGMQIGLLPTTGIPLPFVSYGGSSILTFFISIGLILNVDSRKFVNVE